MQIYCKILCSSSIIAKLIKKVENILCVHEAQLLRNVGRALPCWALASTLCEGKLLNQHSRFLLHEGLFTCKEMLIRAIKKITIRLSTSFLDLYMVSKNTPKCYMEYGLKKYKIMTKLVYVYMLEAFYVI